MRVYLKTSPSEQNIGFNHLHLLTGTLHKWFGQNDFHDTISLYSFSHLKGGISENDSLKFPNGSDFFISCWDNDLAKKLISGIQNNPEMFFGLKVNEIILQETPDLTKINYFKVGSPIFIQRSLNNDEKKFYYFHDAESSELMKETLITKMKHAGLEEDETLKIKFDQDYHRKKTKKIDYKKGETITEIRANWCPVIIEGKPETKQFAWNVGIGNSTGIGFGAIK